MTKSVAVSTNEKGDGKLLICRVFFTTLPIGVRTLVFSPSTPKSFIFLENACVTKARRMIAQRSEGKRKVSFVASRGVEHGRSACAWSADRKRVGQ